MVSDAQRDLLLSIGVPLASFGGIVLAFGLAGAGLIEDPGAFGWGCVVGSVLLAVLAWVKPRKDIVSLSTPLYAVLLFVVTMDLKPNLLMQLLFAASLTVLALRVNRSFSKKVGDARAAVPASD